MKPIGRNKVEIKNKDFDVTSDIQELSGNTKFTTEPLIDEVELTVLDMLERVGF